MTESSVVFSSISCVMPSNISLSSLENLKPFSAGMSVLYVL